MAAISRFFAAWTVALYACNGSAADPNKATANNAARILEVLREARSIEIVHLAKGSGKLSAYLGERLYDDIVHWLSVVLGDAANNSTNQLKHSCGASSGYVIIKYLNMGAEAELHLTMRSNYVIVDGISYAMDDAALDLFFGAILGSSD
jgi:hypothetical protein